MTPYEFHAERFSRWMAYVLRHNPARYGLQPDRHGYVDLEEFLRAAGHRYPDLTPDEVRGLIASSGASRFEVTGERLRARYGHSIPVEPVGPPVEPPPSLYYGTEASRAAAALAGGLEPVDRRMLHLSGTADEALTIARRKTDHPALLRVLAQEAHRAGIAFHRESTLYLVSRLPAQFLQPEELPASIGQTPPPTDSSDQPGADP